LSVKKDQVSSLKAVIDIERYSSLMRLLKVTAWVRRAVNNFRKLLNKNEYVTTNLTADEINRAEIEWVKVTQCELKEQDNYKQLARKLGLIEEDGILRCTGRLGNSDLELDAQKPILLPKEHKFTRSIIEAWHQKVHHCGVRSTLAKLRSRFWVPKGRQIVKKILNQCVTCKRLIGKSYKEPATAALPEFRVTKAPPFSRVGIDFSGPLYAKDASGEMKKVYIALFSCCVTRAVHLELVDEMSAEAFKCCLRKFTARRGMPKLIVSDNAKTFQATEKHLNKLFDYPEIKSYFNNMRIEWKFNLEPS
jgi:transposase InsO family protein